MRYRCPDRMCGALDCDTCYPGNSYGYECQECGEEHHDCKCEDEPPEPDFNREDYEADQAADAYERRLERKS